MSSSVQNSVQQQQVQRTTVFPAFNNADNYATRILQVKNQYEKRYSVFWQANQKIEVLLKEWDTWQKEMMNSQQVTDEMREEYWRKIDIYVDCQTLRNEMRKLLIDYDDLFAHIREPADGLDLASLEILQKLGMNQELIKERYDEVFIKCRPALLEQQKKLTELTKTFVVSLRVLKSTLEPMSVRLSTFQGYMAVPSIFNGFIGRAPYFDEDVAKRKEERRKLAQSEPVNPAPLPPTNIVPQTTAPQQNTPPPQKVTPPSDKKTKTPPKKRV